MSASLPIATEKANIRTRSCCLTPESGRVRCTKPEPESLPRFIQCRPLNLYPSVAA